MSGLALAEGAIDSEQADGWRGVEALAGGIEHAGVRDATVAIAAEDRVDVLLRWLNEAVEAAVLPRDPLNRKRVYVVVSARVRTRHRKTRASIQRAFYSGRIAHKTLD
jgi:hypothetical protein